MGVTSVLTWVVGLLMIYAVAFGYVVTPFLITSLKSAQTQSHKIKMALIAFAFRGSYVSVALYLAKKSKLRKYFMNRDAIKDVLYGSLVELSSSKRYFYRSSIKGYSHWTEEGEAAVSELLKTVIPLIVETEEKELDQRAKDMVMKELKE